MPNNDTYNITIYDYKQLPKAKKFTESSRTNNLANVSSSHFKNRFGTVRKPKNYGKSIRHYINSFRSETELKNWQRLIKQFCNSNTLLCNSEEKMQTFNKIYKYRQRIFDFIINRYRRGEIAELSLAGNINMLGTLCLYSNPFDKSVRRECNDMLRYATDIQLKVHKVKYGNNQLTDKELQNFVPYPELIKKRDELEPEFTVLDFDGREFPQSLKEFDIHFAYLKLCVNTYIPPLRLEFVHMEYIESNYEPSTEQNKQTNYLWYNTDTELYSIVINHDKVSNKQRRDIPPKVVFNLNVNNVFMDSKEMSRVFKHSFNIFPRKYVFPSYQSSTNTNGSKRNNGKRIGDTYWTAQYPYRGNRAITEGVYTSLLSGYFEERIPTQNQLRQAFHTYYEVNHKPRLTNNQLEDLSHRMRHTLQTARKVYIKIHKTVNDEEQAPKPQQHRTSMTDDAIMKRVNELVNAKMKLIDNTINNVSKKKKVENTELKEYRKQYMKKYLDNPDNKKKSQNNRYLNYLRSGRITKPKESTLQKHNIHLVDGEYQFSN